MAERYSEALSIVLLGAFNPAIFHPAWFMAEGLLPPLSEHDVQLEMSHPQLTSFQADWLRFQVDPDRLQATTEDPSGFSALRDLVLGTCRLLRHTPVSAAGVNTMVHFRLRDAETLRALLQSYAPNAPWEESLIEPQLESLSVTSVRDDAFQGGVRLSIEPSRTVSPGVYVRLNDHYDFPPPEPGTAGDVQGVTEVLAKAWEQIIARSRRLPAAVADFR